MSGLEDISREVVRRFAEAGKTLGTAESLTGGLIAATVAATSGASRVLMGGIVSYDPRVKRELLGVEAYVTDVVGVVSEPCARQMALGARKALGVDIAVSATGVAGPTGGSDDAPVGTVYIGVANGGEPRVERCFFEGDRQAVREQSVAQALRLALAALDGE